jgi:hypothetical protein
MMANHAGEAAVTQSSDHFRTVLDVTPHHRDLFGIEPAWLEQHLGRGMQLADIVKECSGPDSRGLAAIEMHATSYPHNVPGDASRVTVEERVFGLDGGGDLGQ